MKEEVSRFTELIIKDKGWEIAKKLEVFDSKEEKKKQGTLRKEKRDARAAARLFASCLHGSSATGSVFGSSAPFLMPVPGSSVPSASSESAGSAEPIFGSFAPSASASSAVSLLELSAPCPSAGSAMPVLGLSTLSASAGSAIPVPSLSAPFAFAGSAVLVPGSSTLFASALSASALSAFSGCIVPVLVLSASVVPVFGSSAFSASLVTPTLGR